MRIDGPTIYLRFLIPSELDELKSAVQPHNPYPSIIETQRVKKSIEPRNSSIFRRRELTDADEAKIFLAICKKSSDSLLGYTQINFRGTLADLSFTAILPEQRSNGIYREAMYLRHRLCFDILKASKCQTKAIIREDGSISSLVSPIYGKELYQFKRGKDQWKMLEVTKEEYQNFIDNNPTTNSIPWSFSWD